MLSTKSNAVWASAVNSQGAGETDWSAYQLSLSGNSKRFSLVPSQSTTTSLVTYDGYNISSGQGMLLSTNGTSFTSGTAGAVTTTAPTFPVPTAGTSSTLAVTQTQFGQLFGYGAYLKPDGTRLWVYSSTNIVEYTLATPFALNTASANGRSIVNVGGTSNTYGSGICFSPDGQFIYAGSFTSNSTVYVYQLSTAWDITTAGAAISYTLPVTSTSRSYITQIQISPDGTKLIVGDNYRSATASTIGAIDVYTLPTPFSLVGATILYQSPGAAIWNPITGLNYASTGSFPLAILFAPDGRSGVNVSINISGAIATAIAFSCSTPWNVNTATKLGSNFAISGNITAAMGTAVLSVNGTYLGTLVATSSSAANTYNTTIDINTKYNVNISGFGLASAPTHAYYAAPSVSVDMESQANRVNMFPYQLDFTSATTTQAVVNAYGAASGGVLQTGDSILLNGTTAVTTTNVVQGAVGGATAKQIGLSDKYLSYAGKFYSLPGITIAIRFTPDGSSLLVITNTGSYAYNIIQFGLSTPWDISTIYGIIGICNPRNLTSLINASTLGGCEFNADGTRLIVTAYNTSSSLHNAYEFSLGRPYQISSIRQFIGTTNGGAGGSAYISYGGRFNNNGTQFYWNVSNGTNAYMNYIACPTPYSIIGGAGSYVSATGGTIGYNGFYTPILEPNGTYMVVSNSYTGEQLLNVNNDISTMQGSQNLTATNSFVFNFTPNTFNTIVAQEFSADGTKYYLTNVSGILYQYNVRTLPLTQYTCTFAAQASAPTSVWLPDRSVAQSITTAMSGGSMTFSASQINAIGRAVGMKITSPYEGTEITNATLNLWKS